MGLRESLIQLAKDEGRPNARLVIEEWQICLEAIGEAAVTENDAACCQAVNILQDCISSAARQIESLELPDERVASQPERGDSSSG